MPLATFSKILSSKSHTRTSPFNSPQASECSPQHLVNPTLKSPPRTPTPSRSPTKPSINPRQEKESMGRNKERYSRAFAFSLDPFNVVASFRARSKVKSVYGEPVCHSSTRPISNQSHSTYAGYEDDEYGEPEADAEEIRRPSGLGRRASITDLSTEVGEEMGKDGERMGSEFLHEFQPVQKVTEPETQSRPSISDSSDSESLVEIRYPSGLGNIKLVANAADNDRPPSTYPHFDLSLLDEEACFQEDVRTPVPWQAPRAFLRDSSFYLSSLFPVLGPYLPSQTLVSLTLVDRAVGREARTALWRSVSLKLTIRSAQNRRMTVDGHSGTALLDTLSTRDVACLVSSLELTCRLESNIARLTPKFSPRSRPPPLILVPKSATSLRSEGTLMAPPEPIQPRSAPLLSKISVEVCPGPGAPIAAPEIDQEDVSTSKLSRRASLLLRRSSFNLKTNVPDALRISAAKLRPPSLRLSRPLSLLRSRSSDVLGRSASDPPSCSQNAATLSDVIEPAILPFHVSSRSRDSVWTPPPEWERVATPELSLHASLHASPPLNTGWSAPSEWDAKPSASSPASPSRPNPVQPFLQMRRPLSPSQNPTNPLNLRGSPSLPSLRALHSPTTPRALPSTRPEEVPSSPATTIPSPITPYSAISLSAFPLPPPISTPPSVPPLPAQFLRSYLPEPGDDVLNLSMPTPTLTPVMEAGLPKALTMALKDMVNLEHVTLKYTSSRSIESNTRDLNQSCTSTTEGIDLNLVRIANEILGDILPNLESLKSLKVICPDEHEEPFRTQWLELTHSLKNFKLDVTC